MLTCCPGGASIGTCSPTRSLCLGCAQCRLAGCCLAGICTAHRSAATTTGAIVAGSVWVGGLATLVEKKSRRMELAYYCMSRALESFARWVGGVGVALLPARCSCALQCCTAVCSAV
jgi:hypothetical protein